MIIQHIRADTHISCLVRPDEGYKDDLFVPSLTFIRRKDLHFRHRGEETGQELDLLSIRRDDSQISLAQSRRDQTLGQLI
jgi:hypothetical protein